MGQKIWTPLYMVGGVLVLHKELLKPLETTLLDTALMNRTTSQI